MELQSDRDRTKFCLESAAGLFHGLDGGVGWSRQRQMVGHSAPGCSVAEYPGLSFLKLREGDKAEC